MPMYELRNEKQQVRFVPGHDETVTVFTYDMIDGIYSNCWGSNKTMPLKVARSYWGGLVSLGFKVHPISC